MSDMPNNSEVLKFGPSQESNPMHYGEVIDDGSSARVLEPIDNGDEFSKESSVNAEIGELKHEIADTGKLSVVDPVKENIIFEPIKDLYIKPSFAKRVAKFIRRAGLKIGTMFLASATLSSAAACGPVEAAASSPEPVTITATQPVEVHVGDATIQTSNNKVPIESAESTPSPSPTENPTPTFEPTPTPNEATPKPTPKTVESTPMILKGKDKERVEVNKIFEDFLNSKGEYTDEKIKENSFAQFYSENKDLGCINGYENIFTIQGLILHYKQVSDGEIIAFGTKNKDGKRIITIIEFPSQSFIKNQGRIRFSIYPDFSLDSESDTKYFIKRDNDYYDFLKIYKNKTCAIGINTCVTSEYPYYKFMDEGMIKTSTESLDPKVEINSSFMTNVNFVDDEDHLLRESDESAKLFFEAEEIQIITVTNFDEFDEFLETENWNGIPSTGGFYFVNKE